MSLCRSLGPCSGLIEKNADVILAMLEAKPDITLAELQAGLAERGVAWRSRHYSPDLNPIENAFSKLKALLRRAADRTVEQLCRAIAPAIDAFTLTNAPTTSPPSMMQIDRKML